MKEPVLIIQAHWAKVRATESGIRHHVVRVGNEFGVVYKIVADGSKIPWGVGGATRVFSTPRLTRRKR